MRILLLSCILSVIMLKLPLLLGPKEAGHSAAPTGEFLPVLELAEFSTGFTDKPKTTQPEVTNTMRLMCKLL
jgi:hypothetical protein